IELAFDPDTYPPAQFSPVRVNKVFDEHFLLVYEERIIQGTAGEPGPWGGCARPGPGPHYPGQPSRPGADGHEPEPGRALRRGQQAQSAGHPPGRANRPRQGGGN
nr:hypothetical protein [Tanacetum cinerariifolium]